VNDTGVDEHFMIPLLLAQAFGRCCFSALL